MNDFSDLARRLLNFSTGSMNLQIARRFAAPESVQFLNGVLDAIARTLIQQRLG